MYSQYNLLKNLYNPVNTSGKELRDHKKMFFDLNDSNPVKVLCNKHIEQDDYWFDMHYEVEVGIVLRGKMRRKYLNYETELSAGEVWINGVWEPHGFELKEIPCEVVVFVVNPVFLIKNPLEMDFFSVFRIGPEARPKVNEAQKEELLELGFKAKSSMEKITGSAWSQLLFLELMLSLTENWSFPGKFSSYKLPHSIQPALQLIFKRRSLIHTREAASECGMSISTFRTKFKEFMRVPFSEFALEFRIKGAQAELQKSKETGESIAQKWGFTDASHLWRYLKKESNGT